MNAAATKVFVSHPSDKLDLYFGARALTALRSIADVKLNAQPRELEADELVAAAAGCDALIAYRQTPGTDTLFAGLPTLAAFIRCAIDIRTVDVDAANRHGVLVTQASAGFQAAVAEWIVGAMISLGRGIHRYAAAYRRGDTPPPVMGRELRGSTLGIVGYGGIGHALGDLALAFGMQVLVHDPRPAALQPGVQALPFDQLLAESDFVVCLAPANAQTAGLFGSAAFGAMKPGACFVNAARGELVDETALLAALDSGGLAACALDVGSTADQMPSPLLARHARVLATPHVGGLTPPAVEHQALETVEQLRALVEGRLPPGAVNPGHARRWQHWRHMSSAH